MIGAVTLSVLRGARDKYGDRGSTVPHDLPGFLVVPLSATEQYGGPNDQTTTSLAGYGPAGSDITSQDAVTIPGYSGQWQVVGDPQVWPVPSGWQFAVQVHLTRIAG